MKLQTWVTRKQAHNANESRYALWRFMMLYVALWRFMMLWEPCCNTFDDIMNDLMMFCCFGHWLTDSLTNGLTTLVVKSLSRLKILTPEHWNIASIRLFGLVKFGEDLMEILLMKIKKEIHWTTLYMTTNPNEVRMKIGT